MRKGVRTANLLPPVHDMSIHHQTLPAEHLYLLPNVQSSLSFPTLAVKQHLSPLLQPPPGRDKVPSDESELSAVDGGRRRGR